MNRSPNIQDPNAEKRKQDHIELAFKSQVHAEQIDNRFDYEPILSGHPSDKPIPTMKWGNKNLKYPVWVSSMTGGTQYAGIINKNLAKACAQFGLGMGLGSCRSLLYNNDHLDDFAVRQHIEDQPLYANLGIAQVEELVRKGQYSVIVELVKKLEADGLIIHINPLQEWTQPEGDRYYDPPLITIKKVIDHCNIPLIVKEVGQGMGPKSLQSLMQLPLVAIDFAANGGTNFAKLELQRGKGIRSEINSPIAMIGHSAKEMVHLTNRLLQQLGEKAICKQFIVSGGVKNYLDGYFYLQLLKTPALYGMASAFLKHAREDYEKLEEYVQYHLEGLELAYSFLYVKQNKTS